MKSITILGCSGSIGTSALAFMRQHKDEFSLKAASFASSWKEAVSIYTEFAPEVVAFADGGAADEFKAASGAKCHIVTGPNAAAEIASMKADVVLAAISGSAGFPSVHAAVKAGNRVALANKEALVCGGTKLLALAEAHSSEIIPVDSEHSAIFQCMKLGQKSELRRILLTASGGPFRDWNKERIAAARPHEALQHPNWRMGPKNSLDSATLANKGLELIEACYFFGVPENQVNVLINPSSLLHSAVSFIDGSMVALLGHNDMKNAIGYALAYPKRMRTGIDDLDLSAIGSLEFRVVDQDRFPCLGLARAAVASGPGATMMFNAANEAAGRLYLDGCISYYDINQIISEALSLDTSVFDVDLNEIMDADREAKVLVSDISSSFVAKRGR